MARSSDHKDKRLGKTALGALGVSVSIAGVVANGAPVEAATDPAVGGTNLASPGLGLHEEEAFDIGLSSFRLFDREQTTDAKPEQVAWWGWGCRGCRGCGGCRGCRGCWGCRGCRGCAG